MKREISEISIYDPDVTRFVNETYRDFLSENPKYRTFIRCMESLKYLGLSKERTDLLVSFYAVMRDADNIADGEKPIRESAYEFIKRRIDNYKAKKPELSIDHALIACSNCADKLGFSIEDEAMNILESIAFDANRRENKWIMPKELLDKNFYRMDISGCIIGAMKIMDEPIKNYLLIEPLGIATRISYNLNDWLKETKNGLINISIEDALKHKIKDFEDLDSLRQYFIDEASRGLELMKVYSSAKKDFKFLTKATLFFAFYMPNKKRLEKIIGI